MGDMMKNKLYGFFTPILLSVIFGGFCGRLVYDMYDKKIEEDINGKKIYLVQSGAYSSYDNMVKNTLLSNYAYYEDEDGLYKSIIGITLDYDNLDKIKKTIKDNVLVREFYSKDNDLNKKIEEYDKKLKNITDSNKIKNIVNEMLELYKDKNNTLVQIES